MAAKAGAFELLDGLLSIMGEGPAVALLPMVSAAYAKLWNAHRGVVAAEAVSRAPRRGADPGGGGGARARLRARGRPSARVDPRLLGGMLVKMEGRTYDGSVRARLLAPAGAAGGNGRIREAHGHSGRRDHQDHP